MARRTRRGRSYRGFWSKPRIRWLVGLGCIVWVIAALSVSLTAYGSLLGTRQFATTGTYTLAVAGLPAVKYSANLSYSADGAFSVGAANPIEMKALVYNANITDLADFYNGIGLLYQDVPVANVAGNPVAILPHFHPAGPGEWALDAPIVFAQPINFTGPVLSLVSPPTGSAAAALNSEVTSQVQAYGYPFPALQTQSYTNQLHGTELELRYAAAASTLVLVLLLPLFYRLLLPKDDLEGQAQ